MQTECIPGNVYIHYRNQKRYVIKSICKHGEVGSILPNVAIYYELDNEGYLYYRDVAVFNEVITWNQDCNVWRYKYVGNINNDNLNEESIKGYLNIKEGRLIIRDDYLERFVEDNYNMIVPMHIETQRKRRTE